MSSRGRQINWCELRKLYRLIGKAVWGLQYLEVALDQLLTLKVDLKAPGRLTVEEALAKLEKNQRNTLGASINKARKNQALDESLLTRLDALNTERSWLVHRSLTENGDDLYEDAARKAVIHRIEAFAAEAHHLQRAMGTEVEKFVASFGFDTQAIAQGAEVNLQQRRAGRGGAIFHDLRRWLTGSRSNGKRF